MQTATFDRRGGYDAEVILIGMLKWGPKRCLDFNWWKSQEFLLSSNGTWIAGIQIKKSPGRQVYPETGCYGESCNQLDLLYFAMFWPFKLGEWVFPNQSRTLQRFYLYKQEKTTGLGLEDCCFNISLPSLSGSHQSEKNLGSSLQYVDQQQSRSRQTAQVL